ncbi:MAG TPA: hypothetical protein PLS90_10610 [Candidatus Sumerlaeota bacterium]|nr:hypothetical protein [Candidatus Sumerlaeota bacterium]
MRLIQSLIGWRQRRRAALGSPQSVWLILFGEIGDQVAALLPSPLAVAMAKWAAPSGNGHPALHRLQLVIVTDRPATAQWLAAQGYIALDLSGHDAVPHDEMAGEAMRRLAEPLRAHPPAAVVYTPEFALRFRRPIELATALRRYLLDLGRRQATETFTLLTTDVDTEIHNAVDVARALKNPKGARGLPLRLLHYGSAQMYDYHRRLTFLPERTVESLGWRLAESLLSRRRRGAGRHAFIWLRRPLARRDLLADLLPLRGRLGLSRLVVLGEPHVTQPRTPEVEYVAAAGPFLRRALTEAALVVADGDVPLFPFLQAGRPVALIESASQSKPALIRCAYFMGEDRLPVFEHERDLLAALRAAESIPAFWRPWADKQSTIEREAPFLFQSALIDVLREMVATELARTEAAVPQPTG